jgi:hypothetical protein
VEIEQQSPLNMNKAGTRKVGEKVISIDQDASSLEGAAMISPSKGLRRDTCTIVTLIQVRSHIKILE